jgi:hypothetical protein
MLKALALGRVELHRHQAALLGGQIQAVRLAAMQEQRPGEPMQLLELAGPQGMPVTHAATLTPVPLAVALLEGPLVGGEGMADGRQQRKQLHRPAVLHGGAGEQPGRPQAGMAGELQKGAGTRCREVLGVVGLIGNQHRAGGWQLAGQARPAE